MLRKQHHANVPLIASTVGLACLWSWIGWSAGTPILSFLGSSASSRYWFLPVLLNASLALSCGVYALLAPSLKKVWKNRSTTILAGAALSIGTLLTQISYLDDVEGTMLVVFSVGSFLAAFGVMPLIIMCLELLCEHSKKSPILIICPVFALSAVLILGSIMFTSQQRMIILVIACLVIVIFVWVAQNATVAEKIPANMEQESLIHHRKGVYVLVALSVFTYGFISMFMWSIVIAKTDLSNGDELSIIRNIAILAASIVLFVVESILVKHHKSLLNSLINRIILVIALIGISFSALFATSAPAYSGIVADIGTAYFQIALFSYAILVARVLHMPIAQSFGFLFGTMSIAQMASYLVASQILTDFFNYMNLESIGLVCLIVLAPIALVMLMPFDIQTIKAAESTQIVNFESGAKASYLTEQFGLTARETEVAELLLSGRSLPFIQEKLCISKGTAKTHLRHIYEKTRVHTRQEFLSLAESLLPSHK